MESPPRASSPPPTIELTQSTPPGSPRAAEEHHDSDSPTASGSTTPTKASVERKSRPFLDLSPLTGFWRGRPSTIRRSTSKESVDSSGVTPTVGNGTTEAEVESVAEEEGASGGNNSINGSDASGQAEAKIELANGHTTNGVTEEKYEEVDEDVELPTTPRIPVR